MSKEWERKKWYLIRSLFSDAPWLPPIPEAHDLELEPLPLTALPEAGINRPYSPLPDLIIEKEQNRHDESEEYYQVLEKKVKKYLNSFTSELLEIENENRESSIETAIFGYELIRPDLSVSNDNQCTYKRDSFYVDENKNPTDFGSEKNSTEHVEQIIEETTKKRRKKSESTDTFKIAESSSYELILSRAPVHYTGIGEIENRNIDIELEHLSSTINDHESNSTLEDEGSSVPDDEEPDVLMSPEEPEIMRRRKTSNDSVESIRAFDTARYFSSESTTDNTLYITSFRAVEEAEVSSPKMSSVLGNAPTSKTVSNAEKCRHRDSMRKRRTLSNLSCDQIRVSPKQRKFEKCTQTSFNSSDEEVNWQQIRNKFFEFNPLIVKLCSCRNHMCC